MKEKVSKPALFDRSGNLTVRTFERYLAGELDASELEIVNRQLSESSFDRDALDGILKHKPENLSHDINELKGRLSRFVPATDQIPRVPALQRYFWYAAAGFLLLTGLTILITLSLNKPLVEQQLAVVMNDTTGKTLELKIQPDQAPAKNESDIQPDIPPFKKIVVVDEDINEDEEIVRTEKPVEVFDEISMDSEAIENPEDQEYIIPENLAEEESADEMQIFMVVEQMPEFPGGEAALYKHLAENIKYPLMARESGIQGRVFVTFVIEKDGRVTDVRVIRGIGGGCDEEAIRVVQNMPNWIPGKQRRQPVRIQYTLPVKFTLN